MQKRHDNIEKLYNTIYSPLPEHDEADSATNFPYLLSAAQPTPASLGSLEVRSNALRNRKMSRLNTQLVSATNLTRSSQLNKMINTKQQWSRYPLQGTTSELSHLLTDKESISDNCGGHRSTSRFHNGSKLLEGFVIHDNSDELTSQREADLTLDSFYRRFEWRKFDEEESFYNNCLGVQEVER